MTTVNQQIFLSRCKIDEACEQRLEQLNRSVSELLDYQISDSENFHVVNFLPNRYVKTVQRIGQVMFFAAIVLAPIQFFVRGSEKMDFIFKGVAITGFLLWMGTSFLLSNRVMKKDHAQK